MTDEQTSAFKKNTELIELIKEGVAIYFGFEPDIMHTLHGYRGHRRVKLQQSVIYVIKTLCPQVGFEMVGRMLGGYNHATVIHSYRQASKFVEIDKNYRLEMNELLNIFTNNTEHKNEFSKILSNLYYYVDLNTIKVLKISAGCAIVFTGINDNVVNQIKDQYFNGEKLEVENFNNTGLSIISKRTKLMKQPSIGIERASFSIEKI